ncbi:hypothetical protein CZ771_14560 [Actinomycetales bacterium JB111]|nr:hypothetical protein CZ771_14560 [Actinomycetales bacterium JB111]
MGWWLTPSLLGALGILVGVVWPELGYLQWLGLGLVVIGLVIAIVRPGNPNRLRKDGVAADLRGAQQGQPGPFFS